MSYISYHISELFWRLFYPLFFTFLSFLLFCTYFKEVLFFLHLSSHIPFFILTNPLDGFLTFFSISLYLGIFIIGAPLLIIQIYLFIRPSLIIKRSVYWEGLSIILIAINTILSTYISIKSLPYAIKILLSPIFSDSIPCIHWVPHIYSIVTLWITMSIYTLIIQLIPICFTLIQILIGNPRDIAIFKGWARYRQIIIWITLSIIAIITPPDIVSLLIISIPFIGIIEISIYMTIIVRKYRI